jgi:hypothetical protein
MTLGIHKSLCVASIKTRRTSVEMSPGHLATVEPLGEDRSSCKATVLVEERAKPKWAPIPACSGIGLHLIGATGMYLIGVHFRGCRTYIPIEQATRPAGVLCGMGWGDQVPLNGSD